MKFAFALVSLACAVLGRAAPDHYSDFHIDPNARAADFVIPKLGYIMALNVVQNDDVYIHMQVPVKHSWMGVGFGDSMTGVRMVVAYLGENGHNVTTSCRYSTGHTEPTYDPDCKIIQIWTDLLYGPSSNMLSAGGAMISHIVCKGCAKWQNGGALNLTSTAQPFIYALGPNRTLHSDALDAPLYFHEIHGTFNLDMTVATNYTGDYGRVPAPQDPTITAGNAAGSFGNFGAYDATLSTDTDWAPAAHGAVMCLAFILIFPVGSISLRLFKRVFIHAALQVLGLAFVIAGLGLGVHSAKMYNKSKHYSSAHQIIGLFIVATLFLELGLGLIHHCIFLRTKTPTIMGKIHRYTGISVILLALVNAGLGFDFARNSSGNKPFSIVVAIVGFIFLTFFAFVTWSNKQNIYKPEKSVYLPDKYGQEYPSEYEMHNAPFATMGAVQTPRTPFFGQTKYDEDDPEDYRGHVQQQKSFAEHGDYTDTPASERGNPFPA